MRNPLRPPAAQRAVRSHILPILALLHCVLFQGFRSGAWRDWTIYWTASSFLLAGLLLFRDLATSRRENRFPDVLSQTAWVAAALLELHALSPAVSSSRIVPAVVFPGISFLLSAPTAGAYVLASLAWLVWSSPDGFAVSETTVSIAVMAALGVAAGRLVRTGRMARGREVSARNRDDRDRSLVSPREKPGETERTEPGSSTERVDPLAQREEELGGAIQRVLEGILPISGADRILFASFSTAAGSPVVVRCAAPRDVEGGWGNREIPESYVPLREVMFFRRAFFSEGEESIRLGLPREGCGGRPRGIAAVPVIGDGAGEGAILAFRFQEGGWTEPVVPALEMGAFFIVREIAETRRRYRDERFLERHAGASQLARTIAEAAEKGAEGGEESASPRREIYRTAVEQIRLQLRADRVLLVEAEGKRMRGRIAWSAPDGGQTGMPDVVQEESAWVDLAGTYAEWVLKNQVHRIFSNLLASPGKHPILPERWTRKDEDACMLVPVEGRGGFLGILVCFSRERASYHKRDVEEAKEILTIMLMGISHALHIETLEERATSDGLTRLLNQKTFRQRLSSVMSRLDRRYECAVIMVDIDHFKRINDTHGHLAGDEVLKNVAEIIRKTSRKADMAARYGGEEFVLYLHQADREKAVQVAERLRLVIGQMRLEFGGKDIGVTASLGIACYPSHGKDSRQILAHADEALYRSKQDGRNRTTVYQRPD